MKQNKTKHSTGKHLTSVSFILHTAWLTIIVEIALKGAVQDFYNLFTALRTVSNMYAQVVKAQSCANHMQHVERLSHATCDVPHGMKGQLSYLFYLYLTGWTTNQWWKGRKPQYLEKTPDDELQKLPHTKVRKFKPQPRLEPALQHWWQLLARKADVVTITPRIAPLMTLMTVLLHELFYNFQQCTS